MKRRYFLGAAASSIVSPCFSQTRYPSDYANIIGLSLPKTGVQSEVGHELEAGYRLGIEASGIGYELLVLNDAGDVSKATENAKLFASNPKVISMAALVGTPHAKAVIPVVQSGLLPLVGIRSGANSLRSGQNGVYHLRCSYEDELDTVAKMCSGAGIRTIVIIHSADSFGEESRAHLEAALKSKNISVVQPLPANRDGSNLEAVTKNAADLIKNNQANENTGIVLLMISKPMQDAAKQLRETHRIVYPIFAMSFTATKAVTSEVMPHLSGLGLVTAFPIPNTSNSKLASAFRRDCITYKKTELLDSVTSMEGWFYASVFAKTNAHSRNQVLQKMNQGIILADKAVKPDTRNVCFKHMEIAMKSSNGRLRT